MEEQAIACFKCGNAELIREDGTRLPEGKQLRNDGLQDLPAGQWPAWEPGPQPFACPVCGDGPVWATEPRESIEEK